ncbi:hypothetical protein ABK040_006603 [Willaertia magna]
MNQRRIISASLTTLLIVVLLTFSFVQSKIIPIRKANEKMNKVLSAGGNVQVGVSKIDASLPVGTPLAGYNHGPRRVKSWPWPHVTKYTSFMSPSEGFIDPTWARCLVISNGVEKLAITTVDVIGSDATMLNLAYKYATQKGFSVPLDNTIMSAAHTHSGPGAITPELLWSLAPATDLIVTSLQEQLAQSIANCLVQAEKSLQSAQLGIGYSNIYNVTENRRSDFSPYVTRNTVDTNVGIIRVDTLDGKPLATLWNFAIHGTCMGSKSMLASGDIMGKVNQYIEQQLGGVSLFVNADAGDSDPTPESCSQKPEFYGAKVISAKVMQERANIQTFNQMDLKVSSRLIDFGPTNLNLTLQRVGNCTTGGILDVCSICASTIMRNVCDLNVHLDADWVENKPKFTAARITIGGNNHVLVTNPGETLTEVGGWIRSDMSQLGFTGAGLLFGYSNNHMGYFASPREYAVGGYEGLLTFWGYDTALKIRENSKLVMQDVRQ